MTTSITSYCSVVRFVESYFCDIPDCKKMSNLQYETTVEHLCIGYIVCNE